MSIFNDYKKSVSNEDKKPARKSGRDTSIDIESLNKLKNRLSILNEPEGQPAPEDKHKADADTDQKPRKRKTLNDLVEAFHPVEALKGIEAFESSEISQSKQDEPVSGESESIGSVSGRYRVGIGSGRVKVSGQGRVEPDTVSGQGRVRDGSVSVSGRVEKEPADISLNKTKLTEIQIAIYSWFLNNGTTGFFNRDLISKETGIAHSTIRKAVRKLEAIKLIFVGEYDLGTRMSPYKVSNEKSIGIGSVSVSGRVGIGSVSGRYSYNSSSSSFLFNKTTTHARVREALENHPEFEFWREQGVSAEMFEKNIEQHGIEPEIFIASAKHYAFEYSKPGKTPPEKSHLTHLIGGIRRFGLWGRPSDYVSHEARLTEQIRAINEQKRKEIAELEETQKETSFLEWYQKYLKDPESEEVQAVMKQATEFDLKQIRSKEDKQKWLKTLWVRVTGC